MTVKPRIETMHDVYPGLEGAFASYCKSRRREHYVLQQLDLKSCLVVMEWAMKYFPQLYSERMSEFYGKRGRS